MTDVTRVLQAIERGDPRAGAELLPLVYDELRKLAAARLAQERPGQTLQATALVHEAYLRLVGQSVVGQPANAGTDPAAHRPTDPLTPVFNSRGHFFGAAAEAMRRILIEQARRKARVKHGGERVRIALDAAVSLADPPDDELLALDEALSRLAAESPQKAGVVKLRFFAGLTMPEVAEALGISLATAERHWTFARTWLYAELNANGEAGTG